MKAIIIKAAAAILLVGGILIACIVNWLGPITETSIIGGQDNSTGETTDPPIVYVTSADELPMGAISEYAMLFLVRTEDNAKDDAMFTYSTPALYGVYFMTLKPEEQYGYRNVLKFVIYYDEYMNGEYRRTIYEPLDFYNIIINRFGEVGLSYADGHGGTFNTDIDAHLAKYDEYNITEIDLLKWMD